MDYSHEHILYNGHDPSNNNLNHSSSRSYEEIAGAGNEHINNNTANYPTDNFFASYFNYIGFPNNTEASLTVHRWCAISIIGAVLGRNFILPFGHFSLMANQYIQIIGVPATRKSTAIKLAKKLLDKGGYSNFAPEKISLEKFLMELHDITWGQSEENSDDGEMLLEKSLFGAANPKETAAALETAEMYIASDEFVDFIGRNNIDFISLLGTLWDYEGVYDRKLKHSKAVYINNPTINIIAGNTYEGFHQAFPPEIQGQGFFSRLLLIHAEPTNRKVTIPDPPSVDATNAMIDYINLIRSTCIGIATITDEAKELCDVIYKSWQPLDDPRFAHYSGRRFSHLLKLSMICSAARLSKEIAAKDIIMANTLLTFAEQSMPKAMGQFGKGRNSAITHKILDLVTRAAEQDNAISIREIIKHVHTDVDNLSVINDLIRGLITADKIIDGGNGKFLPKMSLRRSIDTDLIKPSWLWPEERKH